MSDSPLHKNFRSVHYICHRVKFSSIQEPGYCLKVLSDFNPQMLNHMASKLFSKSYLDAVPLQQDPNSFIHISYFEISLGDTLLSHRDRASSKSCDVTGRSMSSFLICKISAGVRPDIIRRIDIMAASLQQRSSGICVAYTKGIMAVYPSALPLQHMGSVELWNVLPSPEDIHYKCFKEH